MAKQRVFIAVDRLLVCKAAESHLALEKVIAASREPSWLYILDRLYTGNESSRHVLEEVWKEALDHLRKALRGVPASSWSALPPGGFTEHFTVWARGIVDDFVTEYLIRALKEDADWAWEVLRKRYVAPRVISRVPPEDREDVIGEAILRLVRPIRNWKFRLPSTPGE